MIIMTIMMKMSMMLMIMIGYDDIVAYFMKSPKLALRLNRNLKIEIRGGRKVDSRFNDCRLIARLSPIIIKV